jgi:hyperosmotically inducible periplasmic protein
MKTRLASALLVAVVALSVSGCPKRESETTGGPPGGGPGPGAPPGPPGAGTSAAPSPGAGASTAAQTGADAATARKVKNALITSKVDVTKVNVEAKNGAVTLTGSVPTAGQKAQAEKAARAVSGVTTVNDRLTVSGAK